MGNATASLARRPLVRNTAILVATFALLGAGCGSEDEATATTSDPYVAPAEDVTTTTAAEADDVDASTTTGAPTTLPGEPIDLFAKDGDVLAVVGVAYDDVLNVREAPGVEFPIVAAAEPTADDLVATGRQRSVTDGIWYEVTIGDKVGWANMAYLAYVGATDDATGEFPGGTDAPAADTMIELGEIVADRFASYDPPSRIEASTEPSTGDLGEVTFDIVGLGDDSVGGYRLHIFANPAEEGDGFVLKSVERTTLCSRGVTGELCS